MKKYVVNVCYKDGNKPVIYMVRAKNHKDLEIKMAKELVNVINFIYGISYQEIKKFIWKKKHQPYQFELEVWCNVSILKSHNIVNKKFKKK